MSTPPVHPPPNSSPPGPPGPPPKQQPTPADEPAEKPSKLRKVLVDTGLVIAAPFLFVATLFGGWSKK